FFFQRFHRLAQAVASIWNICIEAKVIAETRVGVVKSAFDEPNVTFDTRTESRAPFCERYIRFANFSRIGVKAHLLIISYLMTPEIHRYIDEKTWAKVLLIRLRLHSA